MLHLLTIIGARPQIIKAAAVSRAIADWNKQKSLILAASEEEKSTIAPQDNQRPRIVSLKEHILHTGQHYDTNMSGTFFQELGIPEPEYNLHVGSATHGVQTAKMIEGIEQVLQAGINTDNGDGARVDFDGVILYGDTNSTLAGAVAASKMHVPVFHVEAGLRSFNMTMPEEVNRIVCDQLSNILFAPTETALQNLKQEGITCSPATFANGKQRKVILSGDVMFDNSMYFAGMAAEKNHILADLCLQHKQFVLATIHRDNNTDNKERLSAIFSALLRVAERRNQKIVLPLHPRTRKMLPQNLSASLYERVMLSPLLLLAEPAGFFDIIELERHASLVMTDSGGVQKEAFFFETPCVILRPETEWVEITQAGAGILADADEERIVRAADVLMDRKVHFPPLFGNGHAAEQIIKEIINYLQ